METKRTLQCTRKYVRVKNTDLKPDKIPKWLPSINVMVEDDEELSRQSDLHGDVVLEEVQFCSKDGVKIPLALEQLNGNFSSTTILNGGQTVLQFSGSCPNDSILVMPLDASDGAIGAIDSDVGDYCSLAMGDSQPLEETYVALTDATGNCVVRKHNGGPLKRVSSVMARGPKPGKQCETKLYYPDKLNATSHGGKRGLIRFGRSRMIADTHTTIAVSEFKNQLNDTSDIIGRLDLAPSTKAMMHFLNTKGVNKLFANPGRAMGAKVRRGFVRHLSIKQTPVEVTYNDMPLLPVGFTPPVDLKSIKRITRKRRYPEAEEYQRKMSTLKVEYMEDMEHEEVIIPDCKDSIILLSDEPVMGDEGNIYNDEFNQSIEEEQELDSFPFPDSLDTSTEQELAPECVYSTGDDYSSQDEFPNDKATIIMIENENGVQENVTVMLSEDQCSMNSDEESQVIFCQADDMKDIMIVPDEPTFTETVITS